MRLGFGAVLLEEDAAELERGLAGAAAALSQHAAGLVGLHLCELDPPPGGGLLSGDDAARSRAASGVARLARAALEKRSRRLLLSPAEPPAVSLDMPPGVAATAAEGAARAEPVLRSSDAQLDALCRSLHELDRLAPGVEWSLVPAADPGHMPLPHDLELIRGELRRPPVLWLDTAAAHLRAEREGFPASAWLDAAGEFLSGVTVGDTDGHVTGLPPGSGLVDLVGLRALLSAATPLVLGLSPEIPDAAYEMARAAAEQLR